MTKIIIPTLDELLLQKGITQVGIDCSFSITGETKSIFGDKYDERHCKDPLDDTGRVKMLARYERLLANPSVQVRFGDALIERLRPDSPIKELYVFGERDLISGLYGVHSILKRDPLASNIFVEVDPAQSDQLKFSAAMKYAARIGLPNPKNHLVKLLASGKKSYNLE